VNPRAREHRFRRLKEMGCIASWIDGRPNVPAEIHHLNLGGKAEQARRGDEFTIPLSTWHHRGEPLPGYTAIQMYEQFGPSLARHSREFRAHYGDDDSLLTKVNDLIRQMDEIAAGQWREALSEAEVSR